MRITAPTTRAPVSARFSDGLQIHFKPPTPQSQKEIGSSGYLAGALSARFESHEGRGKNLGGILDTNRGRLDRNQIGCGDYCAHCDWRFKWIKIAMFARQNEAGRRLDGRTHYNKIALCRCPHASACVVT